MRIFTATMLAIGLTGCGSPKAEVILSPMFGVCLMGENVNYQLNTSKPVDWDDGKLAINGYNADVYVGLHPDFSRKLRDVEQVNVSGFTFAGEEGGRGFTRVLYAQLHHGHPLYVMFQGREIDKQVMEDLLQHGKRIKTCRPPRQPTL